MPMTPSRVIKSILIQRAGSGEGAEGTRLRALRSLLCLACVTVQDIEGEFSFPKTKLV